MAGLGAVVLDGRWHDGMVLLFLPRPGSLSGAKAGVNFVASGWSCFLDYEEGSTGRNVNASLDKASEHNERNSITIEAADKTRIGVTQIAGLVARRIVCFTKLGNGLSVGERFGLIRFGSRLDVFLPEGIEPAVGLGQTAVAGETILAHLGGINEEWPIQSV